ncbi:hypothetical protein [Saccharibacillus kuerlensis]|uniref:Uncharacterized protein n=1 Tax=Saccharibacillus kuerlensis TaxID=459527 RepID=A0ABQ2LCD4_9BACL|nr:hypothetical protein [Saccharibacillus kuerlensis]GGO08271.1 hypothetical protein GCM10010969_37600 [Saccharibacillus kuerlensis]
MLLRWIVSFFNPISAMNLRAWTGILYVAYVFLFMLPQLGMVWLFSTLREEKRSRHSL